MLRKTLWLRLSLCVALVTAYCAIVAGAPNDPVSLIQLIANPERYDGKQIQVVGFLRLEFEGNALYLHEDDYTNNLYGNAVGIGVTKEWKWPKDEVNMHYVAVVGTFKAGNSNLHSGTIVSVTNVVRWPMHKVDGPS